MNVNINALDKINKETDWIPRLIKGLNDSESALIITYKIIDNRIEQSVAFINANNEMVANSINNILKDKPEIIIELNRINQLELLKELRRNNLNTTINEPMGVT